MIMENNAHSDSSTKKQYPDENVLEIVKDEAVYRRYLKVIDRHTKHPNGKVIKWDIVGHAFNDTNMFVCVFPFNTQKKTVTVIKEWCQATNEMCYAFPCGHFSPKMHKDTEEAARCELSEEAHLSAETLINLLPPSNTKGIMEVKWCLNRFLPYLALNTSIQSNPLPRDEEELIEIQHDMTVQQVKDIICSGHMMLHSTQTAFMALNYLEQHGYL